MKTRRLRLPSWQDLILFLLYGCALLLIFVFVYGSTNEYGSTRAEPYKLFFAWEKSIPFIPWMILVYVSLNLMTLCGLFILRRQEIHALSATYAFTLIAAGLIFILLPTTLGFERVGTSSDWANWYTYLYQLDQPHNLFPSLHISFSAIAAWTTTFASGTSLRIFMRAWLVSMTAAVVLTHQHHIADVLGGLGLAAIAVNMVFHPFRKHLEKKWTS